MEGDIGGTVKIVTSSNVEWLSIVIFFTINTSKLGNELVNINTTTSKGHLNF